MACLVRSLCNMCQCQILMSLIVGTKSTFEVFVVVVVVTCQVTRLVLSEKSFLYI